MAFPAAIAISMRISFLVMAVSLLCTNHMQKPYVAEMRKRIGRDYLMVPGGRAILENAEGKILLILRSDFHVWALPGGSPNERESAEEAIVREIQEETG